MEGINKIQDEVISEFEFFDDWVERYEYIIELGKTLPLIAEEYKTDDNIIKGCQSRVWLHADVKEDRINFTADSDAVITKGIIALLVRVLSGQKAEDIAHTDLYFIDKIGLKDHLSPTRSNGLLSMVKQMKFYGIAANVKS
jgi:cysteine desulfuration protein SufE